MKIAINWNNNSWMSIIIVDGRRPHHFHEQVYPSLHAIASHHSFRCTTFCLHVRGSNSPSRFSWQAAIAATLSDTRSDPHVRSLSSCINKNYTQHKTRCVHPWSSLPHQSYGCTYALERRLSGLLKLKHTTHCVLDQHVRCLCCSRQRVHTTSTSCLMLVALHLILHIG